MADNTYSLRFDTDLLDKLVSLAIDGLEELYDHNASLFSFEIRRGKRVPTTASRSLIYSAIVACGMTRIRRHTDRPLFADEATIVEVLANRTTELHRPGDVGFLLWADALCGGKQCERFLALIRRNLSSNQTPELSTMEVAWLVTALSYSFQRSRSNSELAEIAVDLAESLIGRFNTHSHLFCHRMRTRGVGRIRGQIANFADQIYSVYALCAFHEVFERHDALQPAISCAARLCQLQGAKGQWWWHYHAKQGIVASRYPVFAVHQDGMAPMALMKLSSVAGSDYRESILRGLSWLLSNNELSQPMIDWGRRTVWRDVDRRRIPRLARYLAIACATLHAGRAVEFVDKLKFLRLNREMRSYHLGWLLYAFGNPSVNADLFCHDKTSEPTFSATDLPEPKTS